MCVVISVVSLYCVKICIAVTFPGFRRMLLYEMSQRMINALAICVCRNMYCTRSKSISIEMLKDIYRDGSAKNHGINTNVNVCMCRQATIITCVTLQDKI